MKDINYFPNNFIPQNIKWGEFAIIIQDMKQKRHEKY